jgi:hypothetical protein
MRESVTFRGAGNSRRLWFGLALLWTIWGVALAAFYRSNPAIPAVAASAGLVMVASLFLLRWFAPKTVLVLSPEGLRHYHSGEATIPWSKILGVSRIRPAGAVEQLEIKLDVSGGDPRVIGAKGRRWRQTFPLEVIRISASEIAAPFDSVVQAVESFSGRPIGER